MTDPQEQPEFKVGDEVVLTGQSFREPKTVTDDYRDDNRMIEVVTPERKMYGDVAIRLHLHERNTLTMHLSRREAFNLYYQLHKWLVLTPEDNDD